MSNNNNHLKVVSADMISKSDDFLRDENLSEQRKSERSIEDVNISDREE